MKNSIDKWSLKKKIVFSFLPLFLLIAAGELTCRVFYYQLKSNSVFALTEAYEYLSYKIKLKVSDIINRDYRLKSKGVWEALFSEKGRELRFEFQKEYEKHFSLLVSSANEIQTKLIVLYIPSAKPNSKIAVSEKICQAFYKSLAKKYQVTYFDLTLSLRRYEWEAVTLLPKNGHLSRFGNRIIAKELNDYLKPLLDYRSGVEVNHEISIYGDLKPSNIELKLNPMYMPYQEITNKQGFRNMNDLSEKLKQRILILGDSITYGPYLPNHDTYPSLMEQFNAKIEVINAGKSGYTITDEVSLFIEKARYISPDITILQVLDNDIYGLFYFKKNQFDRKKRVYDPTPLEKKFLNELEES